MTQRELFSYPAAAQRVQAFAAFSMTSNPGDAAIGVVVLPHGGGAPVVAARRVGFCTCHEAALASVELAAELAASMQAGACEVWTTHASAVKPHATAVVRHVRAAVGSRWIDQAKDAARHALGAKEVA